MARKCRKGENWIWASIAILFQLPKEPQTFQHRPLPALVGNNRVHIGGVGCELVINSSELVMTQTEKVSHNLQVMALVLL